jgi:hypothetical protein
LTDFFFAGSPTIVSRVVNCCWGNSQQGNRQRVFRDQCADMTVMPPTHLADFQN